MQIKGEPFLVYDEAVLQNYLERIWANGRFALVFKHIKLLTLHDGGDLIMKIICS